MPLEARADVVEVGELGLLAEGLLDPVRVGLLGLTDRAASRRGRTAPWEEVSSEGRTESAVTTDTAWDVRGSEADGTSHQSQTRPRLRLPDCRETARGVPTTGLSVRWPWSK